MTTIADAVATVAAGQMIIIVDDEARENEGDLALAAEKVTPEAINLMSKFARGLICMPIIGSRLDELQIPQMVPHNTSKYGTAFTNLIMAVLKDGVIDWKTKELLILKATPERILKLQLNREDEIGLGRDRMVMIPI